MLSRQKMYHLGFDRILHICIEPFEKLHYLLSAHINIEDIHMVANHTMKRALWVGVWWPDFKAKVYAFVLIFLEFRDQTPKPHAIVFQVSIAP